MKRHVLVPFFAVLSALLTTALAQAQGSFEANTNRPGADIARFNAGPSPRDCQNACVREKRCVSWVFGQTGVCWLKSAAPRAKFEANVFSGVVRSAAVRPGPMPGPLPAGPLPDPMRMRPPLPGPQAGPAPQTAPGGGMTKACMALYNKYLKSGGIKAFAASDTRCGYAAGKQTTKDAVETALNFCNRVTGTGCRIRAQSTY